MDTSQFPTATFTTTAPISLSPTPANGVLIHPTATGQLTLHGVTKSVTVSLDARRSGNVIEVSGSIPVTFADYGIANPSVAGLVTTQDHGTVEFLLHLTPASSG